MQEVMQPALEDEQGRRARRAYQVDSLLLTIPIDALLDTLPGSREALDEDVEALQCSSSSTTSSVRPSSSSSRPKQLRRRRRRVQPLLLLQALRRAADAARRARPRVQARVARARTLRRRDGRRAVLLLLLLLLLLRGGTSVRALHEARAVASDHGGELQVEREGGRDEEGCERIVSWLPAARTTTSCERACAPFCRRARRCRCGPWRRRRC